MPRADRRRDGRRRAERAGAHVAPRERRASRSQVVAGDHDDARRAARRRRGPRRAGRLGGGRRRRRASPPAATRAASRPRSSSAASPPRPRWSSDERLTRSGRSTRSGSRRSCCSSIAETLRLAPVAGAVPRGDGGRLRARPGTRRTRRRSSCARRPRRPAADAAASARRASARRRSRRGPAPRRRACTRRRAWVRPTSCLRAATSASRTRCAVCCGARRSRRSTSTSACPTSGAAVAAFNALRVHLPLLQGLSASSPWWFGVDSGLASARFALARAYPGPRRAARRCATSPSSTRVTEATLAAAGMPESTFLWWDVRLHPRYGTVEVREMDAQASLDDVAALAALVRALALAAAERRTAPPTCRARRSSWSSFRAARDGTAATILDGGALRPLAAVARETVTRVAAVRPGARRRGRARRDRAHPRAGGWRGPPAACACAGRIPRGARDARRGHAAAGPQRHSSARRGSGSTRGRSATSSGSPRSPRGTPSGPARSTARSSGRDAVVGQVEAGFRDADAFSTELLAYEARGNRAVARIRNVAARNGDELDSLQALVFEEAGGLVSSIRVLVDDPDAVEAFWEDDA